MVVGFVDGMNWNCGGLGSKVGIEKVNFQEWVG